MSTTSQLDVCAQTSLQSTFLRMTKTQAQNTHDKEKKPQQRKQTPSQMYNTTGTRPQQAHHRSRTSQPSTQPSSAKTKRNTHSHFLWRKKGRRRSASAQSHTAPGPGWYRVFSTPPGALAFDPAFPSGERLSSPDLGRLSSGYHRGNARWIS